jgi:phage terminase large subunit GpA-like protein
MGRLPAETSAGRCASALDCRVYARATAAISGLDRFEERHRRRMEEALARMVERDDERHATSRSSVRPSARQVTRSDYMVR